VDLIPLKKTGKSLLGEILQGIRLIGSDARYITTTYGDHSNNTDSAKRYENTISMNSGLETGGIGKYCGIDSHF
jgi:phosphoribosylamine-glycine ligase